MRFSATPPHPPLCVCSQQDGYIPLFSPLNPFSGFPLALAVSLLSPALFLTPPSSHLHSNLSELTHTNIFPAWVNDLNDPLIIKQTGIMFVTFYWSCSYVTLYQTCTFGPMMVSLPGTLPAEHDVCTWKALKAFRFLLWSNHCWEVETEAFYFQNVNYIKLFKLLKLNVKVQQIYLRTEYD